MTKTSEHIREWQIQEAKNKLSEVVHRAQEDGPQTITVHGKRAAIVISAEDFDKLKKKPGRKSLFKLLRHSPMVGLKLDLYRVRDIGRHVPDFSDRDA